MLVRLQPDPATEGIVMRFVSVTAQGRSSYGILSDGGIFDLGVRIGATLPDLKMYLRARGAGQAPPVPSSRPADVRVDDVRIDPPIAAPGKIFCVALNYHEHRIETGRATAAHPSFFTRFADTLVGHQTPIRRPRVSTELDFEAELAVVIGRPGFHVPSERAMEIVAGFTCFNDASVRDWQRHTSQFLPGKNFPSTGGFGPSLVTPDEVDRFEDRAIQSRLNGTVMQSAVLGDMIFPVPELIAYLTTFTRLSPGDVIATGTPGGVGFKREPPVYMKAGDTIEVLVDGVGHLVNPIADEAAED
jgi:2-keto-4-pentenoate hydratase/2-oxohepta-3-ene-1,7-dioic acid hydratase in catechol pathway